MRSFIAASLLLVGICALISVNAAVLSARLERIEAFTEKLKEAESDERLSLAKEAKGTWEEERFLFCLSVHQMELEKTDDALGRLCAAAECKSDSDYLITVADLEEALTQLRNLVILSPEGVF